MNNIWSSKGKNKVKNSAYIKAGAIQQLANKRNSLLLSQKKYFQSTSLSPNIEHMSHFDCDHPDAGDIQAKTEAVGTHTSSIWVEEEHLQQDIVTHTSNEHSEEQGNGKKRQRGRTQMQHVHERLERKLIVLNEINQPIGPTEKDVTELGTFLGTLARNQALCPLDISDWRKMDTKDDLWYYTKAKEKEGSDLVTLKELFKKIRERKPGRSYKVSDEDTSSKLLGKLKYNKEGNKFVNAFKTVMGPEHYGHLRFYGRTVTKTALKGKTGHFETSSNATNGQATNMEELMLQMEQKFEEKRERVHEEVFADVLSQLQRARVPIDLNILTTPQVNISTTHNPSMDSNNQV